MFLLMTLIACEVEGGDTGFSKESYSDAFVYASCELYQRCGEFKRLDYKSIEDCVRKISSTIDDQLQDPTTCGVYNAGAAEQCVSEIEELACEDWAANWPSSCSEICSYGGR